MNNSNKTAIILGGTNAHIPLIENLKKRGYYTLLADYLDSPPSKSHSDEHIKISTLDAEAVLEVAKERKAFLVISTSVDQANVTASFVAERLGLPSPYDFETASLIANKTFMKKRFLEYGIPTANYYVLKDLSALDKISLSRQMVVKPVDCGGSKAVRKVTDHQALISAAKEAFKVSKSHEIIVEEFCEGIEFSADCFIQDGQAHLIMVREKHIHRGENNTVLCSYASVTPPVSVSANMYGQIESIIQKIAVGFKLKTTSLLLQFIANGENINVLEFAPRIGGGLGSRAMYLQTGFDIIDATVNSYLGVKSSMKFKLADGFLCAHHIYAKPGVFGEVINHKKLIERGLIEEFYIHKSKGDLIGGAFSSSDRPASFITRAPDYDLLISKIDYVFDNLLVCDIGGNSIMRSDIRLSPFSDNSFPRANES